MPSYANVCLWPKADIQPSGSDVDFIDDQDFVLAEE